MLSIPFHRNILIPGDGNGGGGDGDGCNDWLVKTSASSSLWSDRGQSLGMKMASDGFGKEAVEGNHPTLLHTLCNLVHNAHSERRMDAHCKKQHTVHNINPTNKQREK